MDKLIDISKARCCWRLTRNCLLAVRRVRPNSGTSDSTHWYGEATVDVMADATRRVERMYFNILDERFIGIGGDFWENELLL